MNTKDFDYSLPPELIAQHPIERRDCSRMMHIDRRTGAWRHGHFRDILTALRPGDCLVLNDSRVLPARLLGVSEKTGSSIELLLLNDLGDDVWECLTKPGKRARAGAKFVFGDHPAPDGAPLQPPRRVRATPPEEGDLRIDNVGWYPEGSLQAEIIKVREDGNREVRFAYEGVFMEVLEALGEMPLPPYITEKLEDKSRYQTVYAKEPGSAAAPTAGLHFTPALLEEIRARGISIAPITLHVGLGTFRPVKAGRVEEHRMHSEWYNIPPESAALIARAKAGGGRVIAVGTTCCRTLESCAALVGSDAPGAPLENKGALMETERRECRSLRDGVSGWTDIFIYPGYEFKVIDGLLTNFHLPQSTLIMLVSALLGRERTLEAYEEAVRERYRFFSFGDCMLIL